MKLTSLTFIVLIFLSSCTQVPVAERSTKSEKLYQGQPDENVYEARIDEVYDQKTHLVWRRCSVGQFWQEGSGCLGKVEVFSFEDAQRQANGKWRLPTNFEMAKLIDHGRAFLELKPTINVEVFPGMDENNLIYWTSTADGPFVAWYVSFVDGRFSLDDRKFKFAVRLVHGLDAE